jgi:hypothetical protein
MAIGWTWSSCTVLWVEVNVDVGFDSIPLSSSVGIVVRVAMQMEMFGMGIFAGPPNSGEVELYMLYCVTI